MPHQAGERLPRRSPLDHQRRRDLMSAAAGALGDTVPATPRLPDDSCYKCGTTERPLSPGPSQPTAVPGVVTDTAVCVGCLRDGQ